MKRPRLAVASMMLCLCSAGASAQLSQFLDTQSNSSCGVVNASNTELAVLDDTRELVVIAGQDVVLVDTFVDCDGTVIVNGVESGFLEYATDGDGFRSLWWLSDFGTVMQLDFVTLLPLDSGLFPTDFSGVPCDACALWDDVFNCVSFVADFDLDGVSDFLDLCCNSPIDAVVDIDGCDCSELDDDLDGVDNCNDFCDNTPIDAAVDGDGCQVAIIVDDGSTDGGITDGGTSINNISLMCGSFGALSLGMMFAGLGVLRTRRW